MAEPSECPKCQGVMTLGYIRDHMHVGSTPGTWTEGSARATIWNGGRKLFDTPMTLPIDSWRCDDCGYLENYAVEDPEG